MTKKWETRGFEAFRRGKFGNGGQNIYVSRQGVLQRIFQYDLNHNGYFDLPFPNTQNHHESMPSYVYKINGERSELPAQGARYGFAADLRGIGVSDIVIVNFYNAGHPFCSADLYFGSEEDYGEYSHIRLPVPYAQSGAAGRFNGNKVASIAFNQLYYKQIRIFTPGELGCFEWNRHIDLPVEADSIAAGDLDGDGFDELIVRKNNSSDMTIYWGGADGISCGRCTVLPDLDASECDYTNPPDDPNGIPAYKAEPVRLVQVVTVNGRNLLSRITGKKVIFYSADKERNLHREFELPIAKAVAVAAGDIDKDGFTDLVVAARGEDIVMKDHCFVLWGGREGFSVENSVALPATGINDAAITADGMVFVGNSTHGRIHTADCPLYRVTRDKEPKLVTSFQGEGAKRVFPLNRPGHQEEYLIVNSYSRSAVGSDTMPVYFGGPDGFSPERFALVPCCCAVDTVSADLNDDGFAELLVCNNSEEALHLDPGHHIHYFSEKGFLPEKTRTIKTDLGYNATVADFDGDGYLEIATVCNHFSDIRIIRCLPDSFEELYTISTGSNWGSCRILAVDLNKNGYLDLVVPDKAGEYALILYGSEKGFSMERSGRLAVHRCACARAADLTRNGYPDLILGSHMDPSRAGTLPENNPLHSFVHIYWNGPEGLSEYRKTILRSDASTFISLGDFNGDGWIDIFAASYHSGLDRDCNSYIYWNREGKFHELDRDLLYTHSASGCLAADFNEDGRIDLAVANHKYWGDHTYTSEVFWNTGSGFSQENSTKLPTEGPHGLSAVEPGNILDRSMDEFYDSEITRIGEAKIISCHVEGEIPPKTAVKIRFRRGTSPKNVIENDFGQWLEVRNEKITIDISGGGFAQYQLALFAVNGLRSPRITAVEIETE